MDTKDGIKRGMERDANTALVIRLIHNLPESTRIAIANTTGLSQATVTTITDKLIDWGVVREKESIDTRRGRRPIKLELTPEKFALGAIRINREYLTVAFFDLCGSQIGEIYSTKTERGDPRGSMLRLTRLWDEAVQGVRGRRLLGAGVAVPGPFNARTGRITLMSGFEGWNEIDIGAQMRVYTNLPISVEHDANCGALAELWHGEHRMDENLMFVLDDHGIGAGLIINGRIYGGTQGYSGEIGHMSINFSGPLCDCGNRGCLELYASTRAMAHSYQTEALLKDASERGMQKNGSGNKPESSEVTSDAFLALARAGDPDALRIYQNGVAMLALGLVGLINTLNPDAVIFADSIIKGGDSFLQTIRRIFQKRLLPEIEQALTVDICRLPVDPMLLGASIKVLEDALQHPAASFGGKEDEGV